MLKRMPILLIAIILAIVLFGNAIPTPFKAFTYSLSLTIKSFIIFTLPIIIFGLLFKAAVNLAGSATKIIFIILGALCVSNFTATFMSHFVGEWLFAFDVDLTLPQNPNLTELSPYWTLQLPKLLPNSLALFSGIILGILFALANKKMATKLANGLGFIVSGIIKCIAVMIPLFIAGFVLKLQHDGVIVHIIKNYTVIFVIIAASQYAYIMLAYFILNSGRFSQTLHSIKNMIPAAISGFSTMSSAASMPLTIMGVEHNVKQKELAKIVVPTTVNIHLIGDCIAIPIFAYAILKNFNMPEPSLAAYLAFTLYFVLAKFSVAAIPGGGIIVMLPILESYLGFNSEMMSLITALYILFDPVITSANIFGNGAFAQFIDKVAGVLKNRARASSSS